VSTPFGGFFGLSVSEVLLLAGTLLPLVAVAVILYLALRGDKDDRGD
jgi:hypothetical protein